MHRNDKWHSKDVTVADAEWKKPGWLNWKRDRIVNECIHCLLTELKLSIISIWQNFIIPSQLVAFSRVVPDVRTSPDFFPSPCTLEVRWSVRNPCSVYFKQHVQLLIRGLWSQACLFRDQGHLWDLPGFDNAPLLLHGNVSSKRQTKSTVVTCGFVACFLASSYQ